MFDLLLELALVFVKGYRWIVNRLPRKPQSPLVEVRKTLEKSSLGWNDTVARLKAMEETNK